MEDSVQGNDKKYHYLSLKDMEKIEKTIMKKEKKFEKEWEKKWEKAKREYEKKQLDKQLKLQCRIGAIGVIGGILATDWKSIITGIIDIINGDVKMNKRAVVFSLIGFLCLTALFFMKQTREIFSYIINGIKNFFSSKKFGIKNKKKRL